MTPIERLLSLPTDGREFFTLAHRILMSDTAPMPDKIAALQQLDRAMGSTGEPITPQTVADYIRVFANG